MSLYLATLKSISRWCFLGWLQFIEQVEQGLEILVARAGRAQVFHHQRHIFQVAVLAVAVVQTREDAQHLDVALNAHQLEVAVEFAEIFLHRKTCAPCPFPVGDQPVYDLFLVPFDVGILEQRRQVVGDRAVYRILKVDDARVGLGHHQIARVVVAVHIDARLREIVGDYAREDGIESCVLHIAQGYTKVLSDIPLGEQAHLLQKQFLVIGRQFVLIRCDLYPDQRAGRCAIKLARVVPVQRLQIGGAAKIGQQHKSLRQVLGMYVGHMYA